MKVLLGSLAAVAALGAAPAAQASCDTLVHCTQEKIDQLPSILQQQIDQAVATAESTVNGAIATAESLFPTGERCVLEGRTTDTSYSQGWTGTATCGRTTVNGPETLIGTVTTSSASTTDTPATCGSTEYVTLNFAFTNGTTKSVQVVVNKTFWGGTITVRNTTVPTGAVAFVPTRTIENLDPAAMSNYACTLRSQFFEAAFVLSY